MTFVADESVDRPIMERRGEDGYGVIYVAEIGAGMPDDEVLLLAGREKAVLITADKDFGEMVFRQRLHGHGILLIRLAGFPSTRKADWVKFAVREHQGELEESFAVLQPGIIRVRRIREQDMES